MLIATRYQYTDHNALNVLRHLEGTFPLYRHVLGDPSGPVVAVSSKCGALVGPRATRKLVRQLPADTAQTMDQSPRHLPRRAYPYPLAGGRGDGQRATGAGLGRPAASGCAKRHPCSWAAGCAGPRPRRSGSATSSGGNGRRGIEERHGCRHGTVSRGLRLPPSSAGPPLLQRCPSKEGRRCFQQWLAFGGRFIPPTQRVP
jgi:hypothetical protein